MSPLPGALVAALGHVSLETMLTSPVCFGLESASPVQRAICRVAEGSPLGALAAEPAVLRALGGTTNLHGRPREMALVCGVRTGKSLFAAACAVHGAMQADVSRVGPGEVPRFAIVSTSKDNAAVVYGHLVGRVKASPLLRACLLSDPDASKDRLLLRHPSGRPIEIATVAGSRAGASLVARWLVGCVFDEYARMTGDSTEGVVNWADMRAAVLERILPGGYLLHISSPWAPFGPAYEHVSKAWGQPSADLVVVRAKAPDMNPVWWTPERVERAKGGDPEVYRTDVMAEFASPDVALIPTDHLETCLRKERELPRVDGASYVAAMDPATRGNGWTLIIATREGPKRKVAAYHEWVGTRASPLDPAVVLRDVASVCRRYGVEAIDTDQWSGDALAALARPMGLRLHSWTLADRERTERYLALRTMFATGTIEIPDVPQLKTDLLRLKKRVTASGTTIALPETSDGRHCDSAPALMLAMSRYLDDVPPPTAAAVDQELARMRAAALRAYGPRGEDDE